MRKLLVGVLATALVALLAASALAATTKSIRVGDNFFVRDGRTPTVTVRRGTTVSWRFAGNSPHNVQVTRGPVRFRSPVRTRGTFRKRMTRRGTYRIVCTIHGARDQRMVLRVR